ncbi:MAG: ankyrin repeat domain-containing protein [Bryobacteraceae bacterium]
MKAPEATRTFREHPDLDQLKRQAKELLAAFAAGEAGAVAEIKAHYRDADAAKFALHDAQLVLARSYGFDSWPKLKAYVEGVTVKRLVDAVQAGDMAHVRAMLKVRPELANKGSALHDAVLNRAPEMVRVLMEHGASARAGVYPHRDATSALTIATERGYDEIVAIIREAEQRRREATSGLESAPAPDELFRAIGPGDGERAIAMMEGDPALIHTCNAEGWTPLDVAASALSEPIIVWLLDHGAEVNRRGKVDRTPLDVAAGQWWGEGTVERFAAVAAILRRRGAELTARAAVALGDADWLRTRHAEGALANPIDDSGGLLRIAASHNRPAILALLLEFGFDPDERTRFGDVGGDEVVFTWGMPLWHCAGSGKYAMAEMLLERGADPNASVYASGDPVFQAYSQCDWAMVKLLERYGGKANATTAGLYRRTELARKMLTGEAEYRLDGVGGETLAEQLLWGSTCGGDPEIVRMALERVDWPRDDPRWFHVLEQPLRIWTHGSGSREWDRGTYLTCFRLVLERCDPNIRGRVQDDGRFGLTILHSVAGSREHVTADERVAFATMLLDAGARLDVRDNLLKSTPLGWACRWGRVELVKLLLTRGADPVERDAAPWATPRAWAEKMGRGDVLAALEQYGGGAKTRGGTSLDPAGASAGATGSSEPGDQAGAERPGEAR